MMAALAAVAIAFSFSAKAAELISEKDVNGKISANVGMVTEYFFRGITQTDKKPAVQGGLDFAHNSGIYIGTWGSNVDFDAGTEETIEVDLYGGWSGELGSSKVTLDVGAIYYWYPGSNGPSGPPATDYEFWEVYAGLSKDFGFASASAKLSYSPDYFNESGDATYVDVSVDVPVGKYFTLNLHGGYQWIDDNTQFGADDYFDYLVGVSFSLIGLDFQVAWVGTDLDDSGSSGSSTCFRDSCDALIASVSKSF
ncbi:MAG: TorF family putative porin [Alphaproteobacteria bacterium]|nr:TorF family putative porin [Alphaproteobacteria bacterium]